MDLGRLEPRRRPIMLPSTGSSRPSKTSQQVHHPGSWELSGICLPPIREQVCFTKGLVVVQGETVKREKAKFADYLFSFRPNVSPDRRSGEGEKPHCQGG